MEESLSNIMICPKCKSRNIESVDGTYRCQDCGYEWNVKEELPQTQRLTIRNSTMEFLIFQAQSQANGVEVIAVLPLQSICRMFSTKDSV